MDESGVSTWEVDRHAEHVYVWALRYVRAFEQAIERGGVPNISPGDPISDAYARLREAVIEGDKLDPRVEVSAYDEPL